MLCMREILNKAAENISNVTDWEIIIFVGVNLLSMII